LSDQPHAPIMIATLFTVAVAAPVLALASASAAEFQFPDSVPMHKRQTSGPKFECHSACGKSFISCTSLILRNSC
jgi:hypothetical protein